MTTAAVASTRSGSSASVGNFTVRVIDAARRFWRMIIVIVAVGAGIGALQVARATPTYAAHVDFLVTTRSGTVDQAGSSLADDRARIYAGLAGLDGLARSVKTSGRLPGSVHAIAQTMSGRADLDSAIITLTVQTTSVRQALTIASATAKVFPTYVASLDTPGARTPTIVLTETSFPAVDPTPVSPHKTRGILLGALVGLIVAAVIAWLRTLLDQSVRNGTEISAALEAPLFGEIPFDPSLAAFGLRAARRTTLEAFRTLRTNFGFLTASSGAKVLAVSAADWRAGTSTVVAGLAAAAADDGQRVVVVDANQLHPSGVSAVDGHAPDRGTSVDTRTSPVGLIDVLYGRATLSATLRESASGVFVLPVGQGLRHALSDRGATMTMPDVFAQLRDSFDLVLIDTPPVSADTDTATTARSGADGVVFVARYGRTRARALRNARHALHLPQIPVLGAVLVATPHDHARYYGRQHARA